MNSVSARVDPFYYGHLKYRYNKYIKEHPEWEGKLSIIQFTRLRAFEDAEYLKSKDFKDLKASIENHSPHTGFAISRSVNGGFDSLSQATVA